MLGSLARWSNATLIVLPAVSPPIQSRQRCGWHCKSSTEIDASLQHQSDQVLSCSSDPWTCRLSGETSRQKDLAILVDECLYLCADDHMLLPEEEENFGVFRDCLSTAVIESLAPSPQKNKKSRSGGKARRKNAIKPVNEPTTVGNDDAGNENDAEELGEFTDVCLLSPSPS